MRPEDFNFTMSASLTPEQVAEATFAALVGAGWANYHSMWNAVLAGTGSRPSEAQERQFFEIAFRQVAECLNPGHPFRPELARFASEAAPYLAHDSEATGPVLELIRGGKHDDDNDGDDMGGE